MKTVSVLCLWRKGGWKDKSKRLKFNYLFLCVCHSQGLTYNWLFDFLFVWLNSEVERTFFIFISFFQIKLNFFFFPNKTHTSLLWGYNISYISKYNLIIKHRNYWNRTFCFNFILFSLFSPVHCVPNMTTVCEWLQSIWFCGVFGVFCWCGCIPQRFRWNPPKYFQTSPLF